VTESRSCSRPKARKHRALTPTILDRYWAPPLFALPNADDAGTRFTGGNRLRTPAVRMPQVRSRWDKGHCIGPFQFESSRLACWRTGTAKLTTDIRRATHARHTKPRSAMHGLRFANETSGDRAEHGRPRLANVYLPAMQEGSAAHHRKRRDWGLVSAKAAAGPTQLAFASNR